MGLPLDLLRVLMDAEPEPAWRAVFDYAWRTCTLPLSAAQADGEVTRRDRRIGDLDLFLTSSGWDLWSRFESSVEHTADAVVEWWNKQTDGRAILILDGLSLREAPWILQEAERRGYMLHSARVTASELPGDTTSFAKALGFGQRSSLENNGASKTHRLPGARTESLSLPWKDCIASITPDPCWIIWHHWPDTRVHDLAEAGRGLNPLTDEAVEELTSEAFWVFVDRLATGRRVVITSDHGYAASGLFSDEDGTQGKYLKTRFKSGRSQSAEDGDGVPGWVPPLDVVLTSRHGRYRYVLGRRKWKSQGGYPTLTHGGLSVLEVASPFIEISRTK